MGASYKFYARFAHIFIAKALNTVPGINAFRGVNAKAI